MTIHEKVFLSDLYERISNRSITVRMELHGMPDQVGDLMVASIVQIVHGVQQAPLNRLKTIEQSGYSSFEDHIGGIVQEVILIHA